LHAIGCRFGRKRADAAKLSRHICLFFRINRTERANCGAECVRFLRRKLRQHCCRGVGIQAANENRRFA
jgi:hypothetical protein